MDNLSVTAKHLWAKKSVDPLNGHLSWLPLSVHMTDTAGVAEKLWDCWLPDQTKEAIRSGLSPRHQARELFIFLAAAHDIGKATPVFQTKTTWAGRGGRASPDLDERIYELLVATGLPVKPEIFFGSPEKSPHALASQLLLERFGCDRSIAVILGAHHGKPPSYSQLQKSGIDTFPRNFHLGKEGKNVWVSVQDELISEALRIGGFTNINDLPRTNMIAQVILSGLVIMADWIASNESLFPYQSLDWNSIQYIDDRRSELAWDKLNLPTPWKPSSANKENDPYALRFGYKPNRVQVAVLTTAHTIQNPGIMILEAPMGGGKTEAALAAAEVFAGKSKCSGLFFALPTQATTDGMFPRIINWIDRLNDERLSVRLAHSKAQFNERYQDLRLFEGGTNIGDEEGGGVVHSWFEGPKKSLLADFVIGTIDQLLLAALRQKHVMLRHLGLAGKIIIIDECHAYDAFMNQYLERILRWLGAYEVPVIMLSATLPSSSRRMLIEAYTGIKVIEEAKPDNFGEIKEIAFNPPDWLDNRAYPLITYSDNEVIKCIEPEANESSNKVSIRYLVESSLTNEMRSLLAEGGCAGVIVNTVRRSQEIAEQLRTEFGKETVKLIHSRFLAPARIQKEGELLRELGPPGEKTKRPVQRIYVGTQVFEQSLDIDFDVLFTDICPMDLLLQRIGRMHRHKRSRPTKLQDARCYVLETEDDTFEEGSAFIYGTYLLMRTKALLPDTINLPQDISVLVENTYDDEYAIAPMPEDYEIAKNEWESRLENKRQRAQAFRISSPHADFVENITSWLDTDLKSTDPYAEAAVRDTNESFDVLLIQRVGPGKFKMIVDPRLDRQESPLIEADMPADRIAMRLARQYIRLPDILCKPWSIDGTIDELEEMNMKLIPDWQESNWLRGELFLILDENFQVQLNGYRIAYSFDNGLNHKKEEANDG